MLDTKLIDQYTDVILSDMEWMKKQEGMTEQMKTVCDSVQARIYTIRMAVGLLDEESIEERVEE